MLLRDTIRGFQPQDLQAVVDLYTASDRAVGADVWITPEILQSFLDAPTVDTEHDVFVVEREGQVVAYADCEFKPESGRGFADGAVHPDFWNQGIGRELIHRTEARILDRALREAAADLPISVQRGTPDTDPAAIHLFESEGYRHVRSFYHMRIDLDQPIEALALPDGLAQRPFDRERDGRAVYEAHEEAFADHWGFERDSFEEWSHFMLDFPDLDPTMWLIAYEGDQVAGICLNRRYGDDDPQKAWVGTLAVRRVWRKRGLGFALLKQSFALFQQRGYLRAGLGVDASSLTNAVALYERAGMQVDKRLLAYRKMLRGAFEDESA